MKFTIINKVSDDTVDILKRKIRSKKVEDMFSEGKVDALGICHGSVPEILAASDIASKASNVAVCEIYGNCPQHMLSLAVVGETSAVKQAMTSVKNDIERGAYDL